MAKSPWMRRTDPLKCDWFNNFGPKIPTYAAALDITAAELASIAADWAAWIYICDLTNQWNNFAKDWVAYKTAARSGNDSGILGAMPEPPSVPAPPATVAADIFGRIAQFVARLKNHAGFTQAIGEDLDIIGADHVIDLNAMKPALKLGLQAGHPNVGWTKKEMDGVEIHVDRGGGTFALLAFDTQPDYLDTAALPAPGASAVWKYKAIYRLHDEQVGQWSDVASLSVMG